MYLVFVLVEMILILLANMFCEKERGRVEVDGTTKNDNHSITVCIKFCILYLHLVFVIFQFKYFVEGCTSNVPLDYLLFVFVFVSKISINFESAEEEEEQGMERQLIVRTRPHQVARLSNCTLFATFVFV